MKFPYLDRYIFLRLVIATAAAPPPLPSIGSLQACHMYIFKAGIRAETRERGEIERGNISAMEVYVKIKGDFST